MGMFLLIVILSLIGSGLSVLTPIFEGNMVDQFTQFNVNKIFYYAVWVFTITCLIQTVYTFWYMILIRLNKNVKTDIKHELITSLTELETKNLDKMLISEYTKIV